MHPLSAEEKGNLLFILQKGEKSEEDTIIPWITSQALGSNWDRKVKGDKYYLYFLDVEGKFTLYK